MPEETDQTVPPSSWSYPVEDDGWYHAHHALRLDMKDFNRLLSSLEGRLAEGEAGTGIPSWHLDAIKTWWKFSAHTVHEHHAHEEDFFFPWLATRCTLPAGVAEDDHKELMAALDGCDRQVKALLDAGAKDNADNASLLGHVRELKASFAEFSEDMDRHLCTEEQACVALMRKHFTQQETSKVIGKMMKSTMSAEDMAWFFRPMTVEKRWDFATREGIPSFVMKFVFLPACSKYDKRYTQPLEMVIRGEPQPPAKSLLARLAEALFNPAASNIA